MDDELRKQGITPPVRKERVFYPPDESSEAYKARTSKYKKKKRIKKE